MHFVSSKTAATFAGLCPWLRLGSMSISLASPRMCGRLPRTPVIAGLGNANVYSPKICAVHGGALPSRPRGISGGGSSQGETAPSPGGLEERYESVGDGHNKNTRGKRNYPSSGGRELRLLVSILKGIGLGFVAAGGAVAIVGAFRYFGAINHQSFMFVSVVTGIVIFGSVITLKVTWDALNHDRDEWLRQNAEWRKEMKELRRN